MKDAMDTLYEVWCSRGSGFHPGPKFLLLEDARQYVASHQHDRRCVVRTPDGKWRTLEASPPRAARAARARHA